MELNSTELIVLEKSLLLHLRTKDIWSSAHEDLLKRIRELKKDPKTEDCRHTSGLHTFELAPDGKTLSWCSRCGAYKGNNSEEWLLPTPGLKQGKQNMVEIDDGLFDDLSEWISENEAAILTEFEDDERKERILNFFGSDLFKSEGDYTKKG